jgi:hypothetical protein
LGRFFSKGLKEGLLFGSRAGEEKVGNDAEGYGTCEGDELIYFFSKGEEVV